MIFSTTTTAAMETAIRNANRDAVKYEIRPTSASRYFWSVRSKDGHSAYHVTAPYPADPNGRCQCPYFEQHGCCKHTVMVEEEARTWDMADAAEEA